MYQELREKLGANKDLVDEFFYTFMRFEFALKSSGFLEIDTNEAKANWMGFAEKIERKFDADNSREADYLLRNPPKKQYNRNQTLSFEGVPPQNISRTKELALHIKRVRNNLFHGAKMSGQDETQLNRDFELIRNSLLILKEWSQILPDVKDKFEQPIK